MKLTKDQQTELKQLLLEEKEDLERRLAPEETIEQGETLRDSVGELSTVDNHPADLGTELFERSRDLALQDTDQGHLAEVDLALKKLKEGTYGKCAECGTDIPFERLQALPFTEYCVDHTPNRTVSDDRPVEEDVMSPNSGQLHPGRNDERNESLGENAWDQVEDYGNSDSPAMSENREVTDYDRGMLDEDDANQGYTIDKRLTETNSKEAAPAADKGYQKH